jgi:aminoglycoside phosphotransferase (APT) family kinase protein
MRLACSSVAPNDGLEHCIEAGLTSETANGLEKTIKVSLLPGVTAIFMEAKPPAEVTIDSSLVRALLEEQHPDLAHLALTDVGEGWDNRLFRLGHHLAVRVPRRSVSAALIEREQRWLPQLSSKLPVPVPVPVRIGRPGPGFPWPWSVVPWFSGESALLAPPKNLASMVTGLARFLRALHQPAPDNAPHNPWRGVPLATREERLRQHLRQLNGLVDNVAVLSLWERVVSARPWSGPPLWIHGDLHPGNLLVSASTLSAVIDFGDLAAGDPATDLSVNWMLRNSAQSNFLASALGESSVIDSDTWMRARGWALALGLTYVASSRDDEAMGALGRATIDAALSDTLM